MKEIKAYIRPSRLDSVVDALSALPDIPGITVIKVQGYGHAKKGGHLNLVDYNKLEIVVSNAHVDTVTRIIMEQARTGVVGDGKIFISEVEEAVRIRTGERGPVAIHQRRSKPNVDETG